MQKLFVLLTLIFLFFTPEIGKSQVTRLLPFLQNSYNIHYYNPAAYGFEKKKLITLNAGIYLNGFSPNYLTSAAYEHPFKNSLSTIAFNANYITSGYHSSFKTNEGGIAFSQGFKIRENNFLSLGVQASLFKANFYEPFTTDWYTPLNAITYAADANAGIFYHAERFFVGVGARNLFQPKVNSKRKENRTNEIFESKVEVFPTAYNFQAGYTFLYQKPLQLKSYIIAAQNWAAMLELNNTFIYKEKLSAGFSLRADRLNSLGLNAGFSIKKFEMTLNTLSSFGKYNKPLAGASVGVRTSI